MFVAGCDDDDVSQPTHAPIERHACSTSQEALVHAILNYIMMMAPALVTN